jgi:hypothetical protein
MHTDQQQLRGWLLPFIVCTLLQLLLSEVAALNTYQPWPSDGRLLAMQSDPYMD